MTRAFRALRRWATGVAEQPPPAAAAYASRRRGQPLVFLLTVLGIWTAVRVIHHWPATHAMRPDLPDVQSLSRVSADRVADPFGRRVRRAPISREDDIRVPRQAYAIRAAASGARRRGAGPSINQTGESPRFPAPASIVAPREPLPAAPLPEMPRIPVASWPSGEGQLWPPGGVGPRGAGRWSVYGWSLVRQGTSGGILAPGGQYGGSQAGLVVQWALAADPHRPALHARATSALARGDDRTLALGLSARPLPKLPLDLAVERRLALASGQRDRWAVLAVVGAETALDRRGTQLAVYGQAGLVGLVQPQGFFDLQATATQPAHQRGGARLALGGGFWAGGQQNPDGQGGKPWLYRVDIGPRASLTLPVERGALTFALDWRQRIDGQARPASGLALTLSAGF